MEEILNYESSENNKLYPNEMVQILEQPRPSVNLDEINEFFGTGEIRGDARFLRYYFLLTNRYMTKLHSDYNKLSNNNKCYNILAFIEAMHNDTKQFDSLNQLAYYIEPINRVMSLSQVLLCMRIDIIRNREHYNDPKAHNWQAIDTYIRTFKLSEPLNDLFGVPASLVELFEPGNTTDVSFMPYLKELFHKLPRREGYVIKDDLLIKIRNDEHLDKFMGAKIRKGGRHRLGLNDELEDENLIQLVDRVDREADEYLSWEEFKQYFTRRGFPM